MTSYNDHIYNSTLHKNDFIIAMYYVMTYAASLIVLCMLYFIEWGWWKSLWTQYIACLLAQKIQFHADFQAGNCIKDVLCWKTPLSVHLTTWTLQADHFAENEDNEQKNLFSAAKHK